MSDIPRRRLLALGPAALLAGAAAPPCHALMAGEPPDSPTARLDPNTADSPWTGVVSLSIRGNVYSGVLLTSRAVLTAAHLLPPDGVEIDVLFNVGADLSHRIAVTQVARHPAYRALNVNAGAHDLSLLTLARDAPATARRYPVATALPMPGIEIELVGYGASGRGSLGADVPANLALKRRGSNVIDQMVAPPDTPGRPALYTFRFDAPTVTGPRVASASLGNSRETGLARGDSGSGAFVRTAAGWRLFGINTQVMRTDARAPLFAYGTIGLGQWVAAHLDWLQAALGALPTDPGPAR